MNTGNKNKLIIFAAVLFTVAMVCLPQVTEAGSKSAIIIWANSIVPVLLPFFIFSDFIKKTGNLEKLPVRLYPFLVAFLSGYPMGAKATADLVQERRLPPAEGRHILSCSLVTGPAFLMGTVGSFLGSTEAAAVVMASHYFGALANGILWSSPGSQGRTVNPAKSIQPAKFQSRGESGLFQCFSSAIMSGFRAMAMILAYLMLFMIGMNLMDAAGIFSLVGSETAVSVLKGMLEMTAGTSMVGACNISLELKTVLTAFLVSFGGLSVIGQSVSMAEGSGIGLTDIIKVKVTHGLTAGILAVIISRFVL